MNPNGCSLFTPASDLFDSEAQKRPKLGSERPSGSRFWHGLAVRLAGVDGPPGVASGRPIRGGTIGRMAATPTTRIEIDNDLLERLRKRRPGQGDRELLESAVRIQLGREAIGRVRKRFAGVPMDEIEREAVNAVREVRREDAAERRAAG